MSILLELEGRLRWLHTLIFCLLFLHPLLLVLVGHLLDMHHQIFDVLIGLCTCLKVFDGFLVGQFLRLRSINLSLATIFSICQVKLVADQHDGNRRVLMFVNVVDPVSDIVEGILLVKVKNH